MGLVFFFFFFSVNLWPPSSARVCTAVRTKCADVRVIGTSFVFLIVLHSCKRASEKKKNHGKYWLVATLHTASLSKKKKKNRAILNYGFTTLRDSVTAVVVRPKLGCLWRRIYFSRSSNKFRICYVFDSHSSYFNIYTLILHAIALFDCFERIIFIFGHLASAKWYFNEFPGNTLISLQNSSALVNIFPNN